MTPPIFRVAFLISLISFALVDSHKDSHDHAHDHSHEHTHGNDDASTDTIKLHRIANDPVLEDTKTLETLLWRRDTDGNRVRRDGVDLDYRHPRTLQTPLMASCLGGKAKILAALLEAGADPSIPEKDGYHAPHGAAFQGRPEAMKVLIETGIDVRHRHEDGYEPLHRACWGGKEGHSETVSLLIAPPSSGGGGVPWDVPAANGKTCEAMTRNSETLQALRLAKKAAAKGKATAHPDVKKEL